MRIFQVNLEKLTNFFTNSKLIYIQLLIKSKFKKVNCAMRAKMNIRFRQSTKNDINLFTFF